MSVFPWPSEAPKHFNRSELLRSTLFLQVLNVGLAGGCFVTVDLWVFS